MGLVWISGRNSGPGSRAAARASGDAGGGFDRPANLVVRNNEIIETTETNEFGTFVFTKLPQNESFLIRLAEDDPSLAGKRILITELRMRFTNKD